MNTKPIGPFLGINNRLPDFALRLDTRQVQGNYLRIAENVDVDNAGLLRSREAEVIAHAVMGAHSLHMVSDTLGYYVRNSELYYFTLPTYTESFQLMFLGSNAPMSWASNGVDLFFSNGVDRGRIAQGMPYFVDCFALETPPAPTVSIIPGALPAGTYQVAISYANLFLPYPEEGGISASTQVTLATPGGIRIVAPDHYNITGYLGDETNPMRPTQNVGQYCNVYLSSENGSTLMLAATAQLIVDLDPMATYPLTANLDKQGATAIYEAGSINAWADSIDVSMANAGRESNGRYEEPLPPGTLFMSNGRLCSFSGSTLYVGEPFRPGYYDPMGGYIPFPAPVSIAIENQGGTYIAADKTYWIPGDLGGVEGDKIATVLPYGAVPGTAFYSQSDSKVGWFGAKGFVLGGTNGEIEAVMSDSIDLTPPASGNVVMRSTNGYRRVVACGWCLNLENFAATQYAGYDFTSLSGDYGTKPDGIYMLTGGEAPQGKMGLGKLNFGSEELKHLPAVYIGCSSDDPLSLVVDMPGESYEYEARSFSDEIKIHRIDPGKGLRSSWYDLTLTSAGGSFKLASVSFTPTASSRRI